MESLGISQDWKNSKHSWVDQRGETATTFIEKTVKGMFEKYVSATGRFDVESLKIELSKMMAVMKEIENLATKTAGMKM